jgi:hypothetical protein
MTTSETATSKWQTAKARAVYLAIGLMAGPFISNALGWQVTSGAAKLQLRDGVVEQLALICEERVRADVKAPGQLAWDARRDLATKWAITPKTPSPDTDVIYACARKLEA